MATAFQAKSGGWGGGVIAPRRGAALPLPLPLPRMQRGLEGGGPPLPPVPAVCAPHVAAHVAAASADAWMWGVAVGAAVVLCLCVALYWLLPPRAVTLYLLLPAARTATLRPQPHAPGKAARLAAASQSPQDAKFVLVPAVFSPADDGYVIRMRLGQDNVLVVLDSGSGNLSVGTAECVKEALCSAHDGAYRPAASPHAVNLGKPANLEYASLTVEAHWWKDAAALQFVAPWRCQVAPPALEDVQDEVALSALVPVAAATRMDGTSSNILGLFGRHGPSGGLGGSGGEEPVLELMLRALGVPRRWALAAYESGAGFLCLGETPLASCFADTPVRHVPMSDTFAFHGAPCVDVKAVRWRRGGDGAPWTTAPPGSFPAHCVLDTGTALSYCTTGAAGFAALAGLPRADDVVDAAALDALPDLQVELANGLAIVYGPSRYMVPLSSFPSPSSSNGSLAHQTQTQTQYQTTLCCGDAKVDAVLGAQSSCFLTGIAHLAGLLLDVDLERRLVGFGRLPVTVPVTVPVDSAQ